MRTSPSLLLVLAPAVAAALWAGRPQTAAAPFATPGAATAPDAAFQAQGVASCASAACHHFDGPRGSKGSEYSTWVGHDPHARAYEVLFEARAKRIVKNLQGLKNLDDAHPEREKLCLSCHVYPDPQLKGGPSHPRLAAADGVGCEACHGPAEKWLATHYSDGWKRMSAEAKAELGFVNTKDLRVRAQVCAGCHVGRQEMDVNHDLIAAGHPRLRFEYGAYLANYGFRHWKLEDEKARHPDHEARAWLVGQLVSAQSALELLAHRAETSLRKPDKPWPEFAEYNCAGCHHQLEARPGEAKGPAAGRRSGDLAWGTWYHALLPALADNPKLLADLDRLMRERVPEESKVREEARKVAKELGERARRVNEVKPDGAKRTSLFAALAGASLETGRGPVNWDAETQRYLGLAALQNAPSDLKTPVSPGLPEAIRRLGAQLQDAFPKGRENVYDSPSRFSDEAVRGRLGGIRKLLK